MTQEKIATNDLRHSILAHDAEGNPMYIKIRLNDECHNGHQDFSITADIYQKGKPKTDRYFICGGCCHEEILKARPDLAIFVRLHLVDYKGIPTSAVENGFYHLREGFNNTKPNTPIFAAEFCEYYRVTLEQFDVLNQCENKLQYAIALKDLGILEQWEVEAKEAIALLEEWTGKTFVIDSVKTQYHAPTQEQLKEEADKRANGYYTDAAKEERKEQARIAERDKLEAERAGKLAAINLEYDIKRSVLEIGGKEALKSMIFYTHTKQLAFNWYKGNIISDTEYERIKAEIFLPKGVTITNKG